MKREDFNSYGARRGNHHIMMRGTFANVRIRNLMVPGSEGGVTIYQGDGVDNGKQMSIFDAAMQYLAHDIPTFVFAGKEYGTGSSRDWAAKGTQLLGVRAVIAQSYERIHRSNLVGMGVLPLQFMEGDSAQTLGLTGRESFDLLGLDNLQPQKTSCWSFTNLTGRTGKSHYAVVSILISKSITITTAAFCGMCCEIYKWNAGENINGQPIGIPGPYRMNNQCYLLMW